MDSWHDYLLAGVVALILAAAGIALILVLVTTLDEAWQISKRESKIDGLEYEDLVAREQLRIGVTAPAILAVLTGFLVSVGASYSVKAFDDLPHPRGSDVITAYAYCVGSVLILAFATEYLKKSTRQNRITGTSPESMRAAMRALRRGDENLWRDRKRLEEQLIRWEHYFHLYAIGHWNIVHKNNIDKKIKSDKLDALRSALREGWDVDNLPASGPRRRRAARAALTMGPWTDRWALRLMWLWLPGLAPFAVASRGWSWVIIMIFTTLGLWSLQWAYLVTHGRLVSQKHAASSRALVFAREDWEGAVNESRGLLSASWKKLRETIKFRRRAVRSAPPAP